MPGVVEHHHRSTTKTSHKPYKPRFTSKNALKDRAKGKIGTDNGPRKSRHQEVMSKFDRKNQAKQRRLNKAHDHESVTRIFTGKDGAPRNVAIVPLCDGVDSAVAVHSLNASLEIDVEVPEEGRTRVTIERFKQKLAYTTIRRDFFGALDACRAADYVLFILSANEEVDELGDLMLRSIESQGISNVYTAVQGLEKIDPPKRRPGVVTSLKSYITHFFPEQEKVFSLDSTQECLNVIRSLCTTTPKGIRWREDRSWMLVEDVRWPSDDVGIDGETGDVVLTGVVRGQNLKADRLVQVGDWGDFQINAITAAPIQLPRKGKDTAMVVDAESNDDLLDQPTEDKDTLDELAPEEVVMDDMETIAASTVATEKKGVLLDDQHYYSDEEADEEAAIPKRLPKGTSKYQSAWYLGDNSDSGSDMEDIDENDEDMEMGEAGPADGTEGVVPAAPATEAGASEYPQSEMFDDPTPDDEEADIAAYRARRKKEAEEDLRFPDEIEMHPNVSARERLARYRGLKSLRTSPWEHEEDLPHQPSDWPRLLDINDYKGAKAKVLRDALIGGVKPGTRVSVHVANVPLSLQQTYTPTKPLALFSLLRHEHKRTCVNFSLNLSAEQTEPLKSKEELIMQCGARRMRINPLFSQPGNTPNDVHKFERYLHPGRTAVASFVAPLTWGAVPAIFFRKRQSAPPADENGGEQMDTEEEAAPQLQTSLELIGHGTALAPSTARVVAKRVVLTGEPFKIHRRLVTVRYMFFDTEDVAWFKALPLWTNRGRQGTIKESLGTHGYFKAMFDAKINMQDAIGISLYKRVWPRPATMIRAGDELS